MVFETIASAVGLPGPNAVKPYPTSLASVTQPVDPSPTPPSGGDVRRVVIAEDEALIRMDLAEMLGEEGYEVVGQAGDGQRAIELARELRPDLVILDVKMPVLDGIAAAEAIAAEVAGSLGNVVPRVESSPIQGKPAEALVEEAKRLGADLIVVGNRRVQGIGRILGSVASDVAQHAPCDVYIVKTV